MALIPPASSARRSLTGAWIETALTPVHLSSPCCRSLTGAWIETGLPSFVAQLCLRRSLTGAWIETTCASHNLVGGGSLPYGGVD